MPSSIDFPFYFIENYLSSTIYNDLKKFYAQYENESFGNRIKSVDKKSHIIEFYKDQYSEKEDNFSVVTFEKLVFDKLNNEVLNSKQFIELGFKANFNNKVQIDAHASFLRVKINTLKNLKSFKDFPFLNSIIERFESVIDLYSTEQGTVSYKFFYSFDLLASNNIERKIKIEKLFSSLIETPSMINSSRKEFINAFTGQKVEKKIEWLVKAKRNKYTNKATLLYLFDKLIEDGHLSSKIALDLYKFLRYVFVDEYGNELKNFKNTRQNMSTNPDFKDRIDKIISSL
ncbi:hypothetical protein [Winogradskyella forsetii]|uniref:hypothetical protein n=1 Tax=Winogradskyella forsetii TaxID=2686077 RepID=UPI0015BB0220|nr:hypothetical protein [Winogradskyella forsetii]